MRGVERAVLRRLDAPSVYLLATLAIVLARRRTAGLPVLGDLTRWTASALLVAYPLLGVAYLSDRLGAFVEPVFFVCFSLMAAIELFERQPALVSAGKT